MALSRPTALKAPSRYAALLLAHLEREGHDCTELLKRVGLTRRALNHPQGLMHHTKLMELGRELLAMANRSDSGLIVGEALAFEHPPELGEAMRACATVGEALHCLDRHHAVLTQAFGFRFRVHQDMAELRWFPAHPVVYDIVIFTFDVAMASFHTWLTRVLRRPPPVYDIHCSLPLAVAGSRYEVLSPARLHFGEGGLPDLRLQIPLALLDVPMPQANEAVRAQNEAHLLAVRPGTDGPQDRVAWLRLMLRNARGHQPTQAELADVLGVSVSTLSRQLAEQGYSFRSLANEVRHEHACALLQAGEMTVQDIAALLGYAEPANFVRAFRALAGVSPGVYARQQRGDAQAPRAPGAPFGPDSAR